MAKYRPLFEYLCRADDGPLELTFDQVEALVGPLPPSATGQASWWTNQAGGPRRMQARAWLDAGREVERVEIGARRVRFGAAVWRRGS